VPLFRAYPKKIIPDSGEILLAMPYIEIRAAANVEKRV